MEIHFNGYAAGFCFGSSKAQSVKKKNIAVIDLDSRGGLSKSEVGTLTDRLRSMLVRTHAYTVVDRGLMEDVLSEQGFQMSDCTSTDCAVEAGKIMGVEQWKMTGLHTSIMETQTTIIKNLVQLMIFILIRAGHFG